MSLDGEDDVVAGELVVVGWLGAAHGLDGQVRFLPETDFPERLRAGRPIVLIPRSGTPRLTTEIGQVRQSGGRMWVLAVPALRSRGDVQPFVGGSVCVRKEDLPPLPNGQYYHHQIVGLQVEDALGRLVGRVVAVEAAPANDVYVVTREDGHQVLVPAVRAAVAEIDVGAGIVRLRDLPGLLD